MKFDGFIELCLTIWEEILIPLWEDTFVPMLQNLFIPYYVIHLLLTALAFICIKAISVTTYPRLSPLAQCKFDLFLIILFGFIVLIDIIYGIF